MTDERSLEDLASLADRVTRLRTPDGKLGANDTALLMAYAGHFIDGDAVVSSAQLFSFLMGNRSAPHAVHQNVIASHLETLAEKGAIEKIGNGYRMGLDLCRMLVGRHRTVKTVGTKYMLYIGFGDHYMKNIHRTNHAEDSPIKTMQEPEQAIAVPLEEASENNPYPV
jgi:hypothetical protein